MAIQMKATEQYFHVVLKIMLNKLVLPLKVCVFQQWSLDYILQNAI